MSWSEFLAYASNPTAIPVVVGVILSVLAEYVPAFTALAPKWKRAVFFAISVAVPLLAAALGVLTAGWPETWADTFWPALVAGVMAFASGTMAHLPKLPNVPEG